MRIGIVGCGGVAGEHLAAYAKEDVDIVGLADCDKEVAQKKAAGIKSKPEVVNDYKELIDSIAPEAISICTPPVTHEEIAVYALERGIHVLCEKPMAYDEQAAHHMRVAAGRSTAIFMPAFRHRFLPPLIRLKEMIQAGHLGEVVLFNNIFCRAAFHMETKWFTKKAVAGGGSLMDTNSHSIDFFRFLIGEVVDQKAVMHRHFKSTDVEDTAIMIVKAENGAVGSLQSSFVAGSPHAFIDIIGTKGRAYYSYIEPEKILYRALGDDDWTVEKVELRTGFEEEIHHFIGAVKGENTLSCTIEDGVRAMEIISAAYRSSC